MSQSTEAARAVYHLNRRRGSVPRPKPEPQTDGLFVEPRRQMRQWVPLGQDDYLFAKPAKQSQRRLVPVEGWPDCPAP